MHRVLEACLRSPINDSSVLCSAKSDPVILLFHYSCQCPTEFCSTHMCVCMCVCVYVCVCVFLSVQVLRAGRGLAEG